MHRTKRFDRRCWMQATELKPGARPAPPQVAPHLVRDPESGARAPSAGPEPRGLKASASPVKPKSGMGWPTTGSQ